MASFNTGREEKGKTLDRGASNTDLLLHPELLSQGFIRLVLQEVRDDADEFLCGMYEETMLTEQHHRLASLTQHVYDASHHYHTSVIWEAILELF